MNLTKARLMPKDGSVPMIEFMFNPTELTFEKTVETSENKGARTEDKGQAKVAFANINPYKVTISKIIFDTYETGENVTKYIEPFRQAVQFPDQKNSDGKAQQRTPLYTFTWGGQIHLRSCFVEKLTYKLTLFLPDGTPVRAVIDSLSLKEADEPKPNNSGTPIQPSPNQRKADSPQKRKGNNAAAKPRSRSQSSRTSRRP
jgi:Contractile injection system tube protein